MADEGLHKNIEDARNDAQPRGEPWTRLNVYRDYARGRNKTILGIDQLKMLRHVLKNAFSDNLLHKIITEHSNRSRIARFDVENETVSDFLYSEVWVKNRFPQLYAEAVYATLRDGNHAISLNWLPDPSDLVHGGRVVLSREKWWNGKEGIFISYLSDGRPDYAVKEWQTKEGLRRTVYHKEFIQRFIKKGRGWEAYSLPNDPLRQTETGELVPGVIDWLKFDGKTGIGIPVIHLANGSDDDTFYGRSILAGGPLAFQDQINAIQHDILSASAFNGSPQSYSSGFALPADPSDPTKTKKIPVQTGPGIHHHSDDPAAKFGVIPPGDLSQLESAYMLKVTSLCRVTNTPVHVITGDWPSGEAIFRAEMPLVQDTRTLAENMGPGSSSVMHRATEIYNAFSLRPNSLDETAPIRTVFEPPEMRDPLALWSIAALAAPHVSLEEILRIVGYDPDRIKQITEEKEAEASRAAERMQMTFNRGPNILGPEEEEEPEGLE